MHQKAWSGAWHPAMAYGLLTLSKIVTKSMPNCQQLEFEK